MDSRSPGNRGEQDSGLGETAGIWARKECGFLENSLRAVLTHQNFCFCHPKLKRHRCIEQSFGLCGRGRGWDDLENGIETCIISYVKQIASPGSMQDRKSV